MQVADCYIHVEYRHLHSGEFESLSEQLYAVAIDLARTVKRGHEISYTFEEGTLFQRIVLVGGLIIGTLDVASRYHDLRESVIDMVHDGESFSSSAIKIFHQLTNTTANQEIYTRTSSRDMNRLRRIINSFDQASSGNLYPSKLAKIRSQVIHDLAGLARANPDDPQVTRIFRLLPAKQIPELPTSPREAIAVDDLEFEHRHHEELYAEAPPRRPRRRFYKRLVLKR